MNEKRQSVSILKLLTGSVMGIVGTIILLFLIAFLGTTGYYVQAVLFVPDLLGLVQHVTPENTYEYASPGTYLIQNLERGDYLIYVEEFYYFPRVTLTSLTTLETITAKEFLVEGERLKINYSQQYQLVGKFTAPASGDYELNITDSPYALRITPDVSKNVDTVFVLGLIIQPLLLYFLFRTIYRWRNREKIAANQKFRDTRDKKFDDWFSQAKKKNNS